MTDKHDSETNENLTVKIENPDPQNSTIDEFTDSLIRTLDAQAAEQKQKRAKEPGPFFTTRLWFFLAVFSVIVNIVLMGIAFWQHMRIDYLISKIIG